MRMSVVVSSFLMCRSALAFSSSGASLIARRRRTSTARLFSVSTADIHLGVSRLETLQTLLSKHGAPGSEGCNNKNDLEPVAGPTATSDENTPELLETLEGTNDEYLDLHPHLYPLARSKSTGNIICALRRAYADDTSELYEGSSKAPWPIVEAKLKGPGMKLLALNSEHLMRRIACEADCDERNDDLISIYNTGLGSGAIKDSGLDTPYELGSVDNLGYGVDKYVLLRVGPFPDIYEKLAKGHSDKGDESSSLISAEAANTKISGFGSTFLFYARLLNSFPNRSEESRDAARMCLRLPLSSIGLTTKEFRDAAILGQIAEEDDSDVEVMAKLQRMYEKMREHEKDEDPRAASAKTPEQTALDEANYYLDLATLAGGQWKDVRPKLAETYRSVGREDMADFVNPTTSSS